MSFFGVTHTPILDFCAIGFKAKVGSLFALGRGMRDACSLAALGMRDACSLKFTSSATPADLFPTRALSI